MKPALTLMNSQGFVVLGESAFMIHDYVARRNVGGCLYVTGGLVCMEDILDLEEKAMSFGIGKNRSLGLGRQSPPTKLPFHYHML
jgi:hypothetical protein